MLSVIASTRIEVFATYWNEKVRHGFLITRPGLAVLSAAPGNVSAGAVDDHNHEEDEVEPGERAPKIKVLVDALYRKHLLR